MNRDCCRMTVFAFWISVAFISSPVSCAIREYNPDQAVEIDADESTHTWITAEMFLPLLMQFGATDKYLGQTIAGQAEFPWVVYLQHWSPGTAYSAVGNLITTTWVLTDCFTLRVFHWEHYCLPDQWQHSAWKVLICTNYLYEDYRRYTADNELEYRLFEGSEGWRPGYEIQVEKRRLVDSKLHPYCQPMTRVFNFALARFTPPVPIYQPVIGFMPLVYNPTRSQGGIPAAGPSSMFRDSAVHFARSELYERLSHMDGSAGYKKMVCYVASFGHPYTYDGRPPNMGYKVKYRAYHTSYDFCMRSAFLFFARIDDALCYNNGNDPRNISDMAMVNETCKQGLHRFGDTSFFSQSALFMCFTTYAKDGVVCDRERGSPLVCDGEVFGFVARGVPFLYCKNGRPFPFVVQRADLLEGARLFQDDPDWGVWKQSEPKYDEYHKSGPQKKWDLDAGECPATPPNPTKGT